MKMVIKINGQPIDARSEYEDICDRLAQNAPKLRRLAITWWITAGAMLVSAKKTMAANDDMTTAASASNDIMNSFQDIVLTFGSIAIVVGLILLVVKKKWGVKTLKLTGFITAGVFLAPAALLLVAIIAMQINDHFYTTFQQMRAHHVAH